jgi:hypothetical protein
VALRDVSRRCSPGGLEPKAQSAVTLGEMAGSGFAYNPPYELQNPDVPRQLAVADIPGKPMPLADLAAPENGL